MKAVKFEKYGGLEVLQLEEVAKPVAAKGQALVKVKAAGINPGEASIREGRLDKQFPTTFPSGEGSDLAGVIEAVGPEVSGFKVGDEIIGFSNNRASHAEYVLVDAENMILRPANVSWEVGGALFVAGTTAWASVKAVNVKAGDTVVVSGAAGGVGSIAAQLANALGATVIGLAGADNQEWLKSHGIIPITYGDGMADRIKAASNGKIDAFMDTYGHGYVDLALSLGIPKDKINTIIDFEAVAKHGVKSEGSAKAASAAVLSELAALIASGKLDIPIAKTFPLSQVREAYAELEKRHTRGKIVLIP
ncbi:NADPH:quinone reductase-like Zn-dependent oxidoreductase [Mucilaginibacter frigoritolerans]|uniref:NADPH:quinone reductase-like Zn-dependent oxidoreductase n=1 Tax=Mucilaginibacter frigoritolerans TaxID=652788 RepID=A0A562U9X5_9SPHI|nr:NADP-dependent oxidoreductase [Mucilaginibacter frigoritolerans]TWJ02369.1 NADPH:quinone reductase-like Zn-dependent oxidoreductase [Mucilaginibacter frigoritolerans]